MNTNEIRLGFNATKQARPLINAIENIENEMKSELELAKDRYNSGSTYDTLKIADAALNIRRKHGGKLSFAKKQYSDALALYTTEIEKNDAYAHISGRKTVPTLLNAINKKPVTEYDLEKIIQGGVEKKVHANNWETWRLVKLGWLVRTGTGKPNDAYVYYLTEKGIDQLAYYKVNGCFDTNNL